MLKELRGNPGHRPLNKNEPKPDELDDVPQPPEWLGEDGIREWHRSGPRLAALGLLTEADIPVFETYCANYDLLVMAKKDVAVNGMKVRGARGDDVRNPALAAIAQATTAISRFAQEFGLTPSSRSRIQLPGDKRDEPTLAEILSGDDDSDVQ